MQSLVDLRHVGLEVYGFDGGLGNGEENPE
jgi:hypothetical protein